MDNEFIHKLQANLDLNNNFNVTINCCQYDDLSLQFNMFKNSESIDLSNYTIEMNVLKPDKTIYIQNSMTTTNNNIVNILCTNKLTQVGGKAVGEVVLINKTTKRKKYSFNIEFCIKKSAIANGINSESSVTLLDQIQQALDELRDISVNLNEAIQVNAEMKSNIATGTTLNNNLSNNIATGTELNNILVKNTDIANDSNNTLVVNTSEAKNTNDILEENLRTGTTLNTNLKNNIIESTALDNDLKQVKNVVEDDIQEGKKIIEDLKNANTNYSDHINNKKIHLTEDEKTRLLLMFDNWDSLLERIDNILGTGFLIDEDGGFLVDEDGGCLIV